MTLSSWIIEEQPLSYSQDCPHHVKAIGELWPVIERTAAQRVLDAGAGCPPSEVAAMLRRHDLEVTTCDLQADADVRMDLGSLPFKDNSFHLIVSRHSLEHCIAPIAALMEMRRVAEQALIVLPFDNENFLWWRGHFSVFPRRVWEHLFRIAGWRIDYFNAGDFAPFSQREPDIEWRYLLRRSNGHHGPYSENGCYRGRPYKLAEEGWIEYA